MRVLLLYILTVVVLGAWTSVAQTTLIDEDFQAPMFSHRTADPAFTNWVWSGGSTYSVRSDSDSQLPCDNYPSSTNQGIYYEATGKKATYAVTNGWSSSDIFLLRVKASATSYQEPGLKYLNVTLLETNGSVVLWTRSTLLEAYSSGNFGRKPWTPRQIFTWVVEASGFSAGTEGQPIALQISHSGSARNIYFDDVLLQVTNSLPADTTPPTPDAMTGASEPALADNTNVTMMCTFASDDSFYGVQHYFENTNTGVNSGWQDGVYSYKWAEYGLPPGSTNSYRCKARDKSANSNETAWSSVVTVVLPAPDTTPPDPDPMTWAVEPIVVDSINIFMKANTATDARYGVEYLFENTNTGVNSGWQASPIWGHQYQEYGTPLNYRVKARDTSPQTNETDWSAVAQVTIPTPEKGLLIDASFQMPSYNNGTANPYFVGWSWVDSANTKILLSGSDGAPGDASNRVIQYDSTGCSATYDTDHGWTVDASYTLRVNAGPRAWSGSTPHFLEPSLRQTDGTVLWTTNFPVPLYTNTFSAADPWPAELTFEFNIDPKQFSTGSEGENLRLRIIQTGGRGIYFDNVHLTGVIPPPLGTVLIIK